MAIGLLFSTIAILVRSVYRIFELSEGFHGHLWNDELNFSKFIFGAFFLFWILD